MTVFTQRNRASSIAKRLSFGAMGLAMLALAACNGTATVSPGTGPRVNTNAPVTVALLLPRGSGQAGDEFVSRSLENAARMAIADLNGAQIDLRVYSTAANPQMAANAANLAVEDGAKVILGPVYAASAAAAGLAVAGSGVQVLSFSNNTSIAGGNVFVLGNTFEATADRLVRYAVAQGKTQILTVAGQNEAEALGSRAIAGAIARNGASSAGTTSFELSQNGVVQAIPEITDAVKANGAQAVFYTSGTAGALPILAQLVSENGVDPAKVQFIGLQRWDIPASAQALPPLQGGWFAIPDPGLIDNFNKRYIQQFGDGPHPIAGLGYDGIAAVGALISSGVDDPLGVAALTGRSGFAGVNGVFRLRANGTNERGLSIASLINNQVQIIDPAPRSFGDAGF